MISRVYKTINKCLNKVTSVKRGKGALGCNSEQWIGCDTPLDEVPFRNIEIFYKNCD